MTQQVLALKVDEKRGWDIVPIWVERFALPVLGTAIVGLVIFNVLKMDWIQKTGIALGIFGFSLFLAQTLHLYNQAKADSTNTVQQGEPKKPDSQQTSGNNSPIINIPGNNNTTTVTIAPPAKNPPKKGEKATDIAESAALLGGGFRESTTDSDLIEMRLGGLSASNPRGWLKNGAHLGIKVGPAGAMPIDLVMDKQGKPLFTCTIVAGDEAHPFFIEIKNNVFKIVGGFVQKNYNDTALEIADEQGAPLFQVIQEGKSLLRINGVFVLGRDSSGKIVRLWARGDRFEGSVERPVNFSLKPIFKYPSWKYLGKYAD